MRRKYRYALVGLLAVFLLSWWLRKDGASDKPSSIGQPDAASEGSRHPTKTDRHPRSTGFGEKIRTFFNDADTEINFYGRIVDQDGRGVEGAIVHYQLERAGILMADNSIANNNEKSSTVSTASGAFSIQGARGLTLSIHQIEKEGYRDGGQTARSFGYKGTPDVHSPNSETARPSRRSYTINS